MNVISMLTLSVLLFAENICSFAENITLSVLLFAENIGSFLANWVSAITLSADFKNMICFRIISYGVLNVVRRQFFCSLLVYQSLFCIKSFVQFYAG